MGVSAPGILRANPGPVIAEAVLTGVVGSVLRVGEWVSRAFSERAGDCGLTVGSGRFGSAGP